MWPYLKRIELCSQIYPNIFKVNWLYYMFSGIIVYFPLKSTKGHIAAYKRPPTITANQSTIVVPENFGKFRTN